MLTSGFREWSAYQEGFKLARAIHRMTIQFPPGERSLVDQIRRCSRSVCANLAEVYAVRSYPKHYRSKLAIAIGENYETQVWLDFAPAAGYLNSEQHRKICGQSERVGRLLSYMKNNQEQFATWRNKGR
jgi:four helix bundle protein